MPKWLDELSSLKSAEKAPASSPKTGLIPISHNGKRNLAYDDLISTPAEPSKKASSDGGITAPVGNISLGGPVAPKYAAGLLAENEMIRATTQSILDPQTPQAKKVGTFTDPVPDTPLEVLKKQMEEETDRGKKTELTKLYNDKMLATYSDLFSKTQAEGQSHTMLEEIEALANMDGGDEKKQRKETLLRQMEALGMPKDYYGFFAGDGSFDIGNAAKWAGSAAGAGIAGFEKGLFDTADLLLGAPLREIGKQDNIFGKVAGFYGDIYGKAADYFGDIYASNAYNREVYANRMGGGKGLEFAGSAIEGVMGAVPTAVLAMMTGGASLGASTTELQTMAAYRAGNILSKAGITVQTMMQNPQFWVSFARTYGSDYAEAKERGANDTVASLGAMLTSLVNAGIEIGPDGASGIQGLPKEIVGNHDLSTKEKIFDWVASSLEEGGEEILQKGVTDLVTAAAYPNKEGLFDPVEYLQEGALGAISGAVMGAGQLAANEIVDAVNSPERFTRYEQAVLNNEIQSRIAEAEQNGPVSKAQMAKIRESAIHDLKMGYLSTDSIEGVLGELSGSDAYTSYQALMGLDEDTQFLSEYDALGARQDLTPEEAQKYTDMGARAQEIRDAREAAKSRLSKDVQEMVDGGRLSESYAEQGRRRERFTADLDIYPDGPQKQVIQNAMESGVLNNTNRSHELVDLVSQIAADKGIAFDFTNNAHLKAAGLDIDGVTVNGFVSDKGVTLNVNSDKALNSVVGHEITHVLEGTQAYTELQRALFDYAKSKGEFESRFDSLADTYRTVYSGLDDAALREKINQELTADLIGDLMFTDSDFVKQLSARNQNVFQKIYSEVQYLAQAAKGGSKAGQLLQEAQRAFREAYRENGSLPTETKYSITGPFVDTNGTHFDNAVLLDTDFFDGTPPRRWGDKLRDYVDNRAANDPAILPIVDENGETTVLEFAKPDERVTKTDHTNHRVLNKFLKNNDNISKLAVIHIDEIVSVSEENSPYYTNEHNHQWMDEHGWLHRNANVINSKNGNIYNITLDIAKTADGRTILYATDGKTKKVGNANVNSLNIKGSKQNSNFSYSLSQDAPGVKNSFVSDNDLGPVAEKWQIKGEDISLEEELETLRDLGKTDFQAEEDILAGINEEPNEGTQTEEDFPIGPEPETRAQEQKAGVEEQDAQQEENVNAAPEEQTPADRVKKDFRDKAMRDAVKSSGVDISNPDTLRKIRVISKAVEQAQDFCSKGIVGVKSIPEIFNQFIEDGSLADFESYLRHELNVDRYTLEERFGTENKPVFGPDVTAEISRQRAAELLQQHPKFRKAAEDVYTFTRYLKDMMVRSGKMSQGLADHLQEMYPHYIPIGRTRNGYQPVYGQILDFLQGGYIDMDDGDALNVFLGDVDDATGIKGITSYGTDFDSLQNSLVDYAMRAHMALAMGTDTFDTDAPLFNETRSRSTDYGPVAGQNETVKAPDMDVPDFGESGQNGNAAADTQTSYEHDSVPVADNDADALDFLQEEPNDQFLDLDGENVHPAALKSMVQYRSPIRIALDFLGEHLFDKGIVFESLGDKVGDRGLPALWHAMRTAASKGQYLIGNGDKSKGVRALADIYKEVKKSGKMEDFSSYISNLRNMDGLSLQARYGVAKDQAFVKNVSYADSVSIVRELETNNPKFKTWAQDLFAYSNNLVDMMVESGTLSEGNAELLRELYPHYVPVRYGKDGKLKTPFDSLGSLTMEIAKGTATNEFSQRLSGTLQSWSKSEAVDIEKVIGKLDRGKNLFQFDEDGMQDGYHTYTVYDRDKKLTYRISDRMYSAMKPVADLLNVRVPGLSGFSKLSRNLITAYNPFFALSNAVKDFQEVVLHSQHPVETYASMPKAIFEIATKGDLYQEYVTNGGEYCTYFDTQEGTFDAKKGVTDYLENMIGLKQILAVNDFIESIPRFSEYMASREKGKPIAEAMLDAAQVTVNFSAGGDVSKFIDRNGCTFFNASMQGLVQGVRDINQARMNGVKGVLGLITRCLVAGVPPVVAAAMLHKDDDEYDELPDYVKENYYLPFKFADGTYVRIPKGRTNAVIQYAMEQVAKVSKGDDTADWGSFLRICVENLAPNNPWNDNIIAPIVQVRNNKSWFGEDIVPYRLKDLPAAEQYDEKTDLLSIWLGEKLNYSPKKINYLLNQYSGVLGDTVLPFLTPKAESPYDNPVAKVMAPLRDRFTTDVVLNNRVTGDFYEALEAAEVKAQEEGATMEDKLLSSVLIGYNVKVSKLMKQQREIQSSGLLDSEKYAQNKELKRQINDLEREALDAANQMKITGVYAEAGGNRYNYGKDSTTGEERWFEITPKKKDGTDNWYYKQEQAVTKGLGISPAEYWNHRQMYDDFYYVAAGYDKDSTADDVIETARAVFGYERFAEYASVLKTLRAGKDADGNPIRGTKFKKVQAFVDRLDIPDIEKKILMKMFYPSNNRNSYEIVQWLDENDSISRESFVKILGELGYKIDDQGMVTWW